MAKIVIRISLGLLIIVFSGVVALCVDKTAPLNWFIGSLGGFFGSLFALPWWHSD